MATKYSILSALIRPQIGEKISIGLLLTDDTGHAFFSYSKDKLAAAKHLMSDAAVLLLKDGVRNIATAARQEARSSTGQPTLENLGMQSLFSDSYIAYLSRYNNSILQFSAPKDIDVAASQLSFQQLYELYVDNSLPLAKAW